MSYISAIRKGEEVLVWERTDKRRELLRFRAPYYFFVEDPNGEHVSIYGDKLSKVEANTYKEYQYRREECRNDNLQMFESDIPAELKLLSTEYYQKDAPKLNVTFLDIEVDYNPEIGFSTIETPYAPINSVALYNQWEHNMAIYAIAPEDGWTDELLLEKMNDVETLPKDVEVEAHLVKNEKHLLFCLLEEIKDADVVCGWNSDFFDMPYIGKRIEKILEPREFQKLSFPGAGKPRYRKVEKYGKEHETLDIYGRISWDYLELFRKYEAAERPSYKLASIADEMLPELPKLQYNGTLANLYRSNFAWFCRYNLRDTEVLKGFEEKLGYVALANEMYHLSTGSHKHVLGTLKLAELAINNHCIHELGQRVPDMSEPDTGGGIAGAFVLEPKTGMHDWIGSIDINSLYPAAIRSINISPEKIIGQFRDEVKASQEIAKGSFANLTLDYEDDTDETHTADEWRNKLREQKWAVSGYGTVFNQDAKGIIPSILQNWYNTRQQYQALERTEEDKTKKEYNFRLQYVYKIKLNSLYGALTNAYFRYFDLRMGESTTGTGRAILKHQCAKANEAMTGEYDPSGEAVLYGDTDSTYFALWAEHAEEAVKVADAVGELVNASFQQFMQETFLCQPGFDDIIKAGREIVASRGIFVEKKRYILHVINNDGKTVDKIKVMGLDTKKTTIPPHVGKKLNGFVGRLLRKEGWDTIATDIVDYKEWVRTTEDIMMIGLPRGVNNVEDYTTRWTNDVSTRLPGHVAAAIHYNQLLNDYEDKVSIPIMSGMKIKVFYLTQKYGQFRSIALPTDIDFVPEWFLKNYIINRDMHIARLVDNPLGNIIKAIGREVPTAQSLVVDDLLGF